MLFYGNLYGSLGVSGQTGISIVAANARICVMISAAILLHFLRFEVTTKPKPDSEAPSPAGQLFQRELVLRNQGRRPVTLSWTNATADLAAAAAKASQRRPSATIAPAGVLVREARP